MKKCPTCGNSYRPDVEECPNDGTKLGPVAEPPPRAPPPVAAAPPPPSTSPPKPKPAPRAAQSYGEISTLTEHSTVSSWIFALVACGLLLGAYWVARGYLMPAAESESDVPSLSEDDSKSKSKKKRKGKRSRKAGSAAVGGENFDDYDWEQDYAEDDLVLGDIASQRDEVYEEAPVVREPEPYDPKPNEWQGTGSYRPTASWSEPGAKSNVVELDLTAPSNASPLDESQVKQVLSVRKLSSCYDPWVQKIPQMRGRVDMTFVVAADGHVAAVEITRSQLRSRVVESCIVSKARGFRFPRAQGGAKTRFDTHFDFTNR